MDNRKIIELKQQLVTLEGQKSDLSEKFKKKKSNSSTGNVLMLIAGICLIVGFVAPPVWAIFILLLIIGIVMYGMSSGKSAIQTELTNTNKQIENAKKEIIEIENS